MNARRLWVNPLDLKWSHTTRLKCYAKKDTSEMRAAVTPVLIVRDTPEARRLLKIKRLTP